jgi:pyruvate/2-oxoglutarate dehydrogenase complex dihydrolipoamide acyltransferase (E2) component
MDLQAPVASRIANLPVAVGDLVAVGDTLAVLEVMKMEHPIIATQQGVVTAVKVGIGDAVEAGDLLMSLEPSGAGSDEWPSEDTSDMSSLREVEERHRLVRDRDASRCGRGRHERGWSPMTEPQWSQFDSSSGWHLVPPPSGPLPIRPFCSRSFPPTGDVSMTCAR